MQLKVLGIMPDTNIWQQSLGLKLGYQKMLPGQVGLPKVSICPHAIESLDELCKFFI